MSYAKLLKSMPTSFKKAVELEGNPEAKAPVDSGGKRGYANVWRNPWLISCLYNQWRYAHALYTGKTPSKYWFYTSDDDQNELDWKTTAMHIMNAEYAGNATYEWFDWKVVNGKEEMYRVNQFDRITDISDPRLNNPVLDYLFTFPEKTVRDALRDYKMTLSEKKN